MTVKNKVYVGSIGTVIVLDCGQDITAASVRRIDVRKPDGTVVTWAAVASGSTALRFVTVSGTLDQPGRWLLQAHVTLPTGDWPGDTVALDVFAAFT